MKEANSNPMSAREFELRLILAHRPDGLNSVAWSPNRDLLARGSDDCTVQLWDTDGGKLIKTLESHTDYVWSVAWSPEGSVLASGSNDGTVKLWNVETAEVMRTIDNYAGAIWSVAWSPDGTSLACGSNDGTVKVWQVESGKLVHTLKGHASAVRSVAWAPYGGLVASGSDDSTVRLWDTETGTSTRTLQDHANEVRSVAWSPDGNLLASGSYDRTVKLWDTRGGLIHTLEGHTNWVLSVAWSPDGNVLASGSDDSTVRLTSTKSGKVIHVLEGHINGVRSVAWSVDGRVLASGSYDRTVKLWDTTSGSLIRTLQGRANGVRSVAWSADGRLLASGFYDGTVKLWDSKSGNLITTLEGHTDGVRSLAWSSDGRLASGSYDHTVKVWDTTRSELSRTLEGHANWVLALAWSPDGSLLASGSSDRIVTVWDAESGRSIHTLEGHADRVLVVEWSPQECVLASGSSDRTVKLWNTKNGDLIGTLEGHTNAVRSLAWSANGTALASGSDDGTVKLWDAKSGKLIRTLEGHTNWIRSLAWSSHGSVLASGSDDRTVKVWDTREGADLSTFREIPASHYTLSVAFHQPARVASVFGETVDQRPDVIVRTIKLPKDGLSSSVSPVSFASAKIVLVGESGVGKSCLASRLVQDSYDEEQRTTHGMRLWSMPAEQLSPNTVGPAQEKRELVLWDLGGQEEYQLIHQLFLHDTTLALVLLDPTRGQAEFEHVAKWNLLLEKQTHGRSAVKFLIGTKLDDGSDVINRDEIDRIIRHCGFRGYFPTSAKMSRGIGELGAAIAREIDWDDLSKTTRPRLFQLVREAVTHSQQQGEAVLLYSDLEKRIRAEAPEEFESAAVTTVVDQLAAQGVIAETRLAGGERALVLQIGYVEQYAGSLILAARQNNTGVPAIEELAVVSRRLALPRLKQEDRLDPIRERIALECVVQLMLERGLCLRHQGLLIFPGLFREAESHEGAAGAHTLSLYYDFSGAIDNIYSSLVVALALGERFGRVRMWKDRAEYESPKQGVCGLRKTDRRSGSARLDLLFSEETHRDSRRLFTSFVEDHLRQEGVTIREVIEVVCPCGYGFEQPAVQARIDQGRSDILCPVCERRNPMAEGPKHVRPSARIEKELVALKTDIEVRSRTEVIKTKLAFAVRQTPVGESPISILHLSDLHISVGSDPISHLQPLVADLKDKESGLGLDTLDYLVVSGDLTDYGKPEEFDRAYQFISELIKKFGLSAERCVIVPGNHDLNWLEQVYDWKGRRKGDAELLSEGSFVEQEKVLGLRNSARYPMRFKNFNDHFYHPLMQKEYPLTAEEQCLSFLFRETRLLFLAMNSAWEIDEFFPDRSGINDGALSRGLLQAAEQVNRAREDEKLTDAGPFLGVAVWHHPISGNEKIRNDVFIDRLTGAGVRVCLHGHVHENRAEVLRYWHQNRLYVVGAGSFGAPWEERSESTPRLYNLLQIERDHSAVRVHTRRRDKATGAWQGWYEWPIDTGSGRQPYYDIDLK